MQTSAAQDAMPTAQRVQRTSRSNATTVTGSGVPAVLHASRRRPVRRGRLGAARRPSSATKRARWSSSSATSRSRSPGRSRPPTSSSRSTSAATWARPSASARVKQLIGRVVDTITDWARDAASTSRAEADLQAFSDDLKHLLVYQKARLQQPRVVQLRLRDGAAVLGLLHQLGQRHDGLDPRRWPRPRACCSSSARAPARTCRRSARRRSCSPAAARRPARSRS